MKKKVLRVLGIIVLLFVALLIAIPFFLEGKIGAIIKNNVNQNVNATLDFSDASLSLFSSFPNAEVSLNNVSLVNEVPFKGDTLFAAKGVSLKMGLTQLFNGGNDPISIQSLALDEALVHIKVDEDENANYDISKEVTEVSNQENTTSDGFAVTMESYEISNSKVMYDDFSTGLHLEILEMNHKGTGDLSLATSELNTHTDALVSFEMDSTNYLNRNKVQLDALLGIDLNENKYTFLKSDALLNQLPLVFDGFVKLNEDESQDVAISFKTPSSDFKNFLAVIPEVYSKNIANVKTTGNFMVDGNFTGTVDETHIPKFNINISSENASFKYPDLPKTVSNIFLDIAISNTSGITEDTFVNVNKASFKIDNDSFNLTSHIAELLGNTSVKAHIEGNMNLANIAKAYPVPEGLGLKGILNANITTAFDMAAIDKKQYENTKTTGEMLLTNFEYKDDEIPNPVVLKSVAVAFNPKTVRLNELIGATGKTDFKVTGSIHNFLGHLFNHENVEGNFSLKSNMFNLNDFMVAAEGNSNENDGNTQVTEKIKIPSFLDANFNASANTVIYDNITLKDVKGNLTISDEKAVLSQMTSSLFNGKVAFNGEVSTKEDVPTFRMNLGMDQLKIGETFKAIDLFKALAPVAEVLKGDFSSDIVLSGNLSDDFTPDLLSLSGNVLTNVLTREINAEKAPILTALGNQLNFINTKQLSLKGLKTKLSFKDGVVAVKPFVVAYKDMDIVIDGKHTFDRKMNYKASLEVPVKYLGKDINALIARIDDASLADVTIPVTATIGGVYNSPQVSTDFTSGVKNLTNQLIEIEKQKLINRGKDKAKDLIGGVLSGNTAHKDSLAKEDPTKDSAQEVLETIIGSNKKTDSTKVQSDTSLRKKDDAVKDAAKDILGGLFGKKKKTAIKKDSVN